MKIKEICVDERPREKMLAKGADAMSNAELLAILIGSGTQKENVLEVANRLLAEAQRQVVDDSRHGRQTNEGDRRYRQCPVCGHRRRLRAREKMLPGGSRNRKGSLDRCRDCVQDDAPPRLKGLDHEEFWVILLNRANYIIHKEMISLGGISSTVVDSKLVVRMALDKRASGLIMVHNHPSGNPRPGHNDLTETERMKKSGEHFRHRPP